MVSSRAKEAIGAKKAKTKRIWTVLFIADKLLSSNQTRQRPTVFKVDPAKEAAQLRRKQ
jgi:hypothetical protein